MADDWTPPEAEQQWTPPEATQTVQAPPGQMQAQYVRQLAAEPLAPEVQQAQKTFESQHPYLTGIAQAFASMVPTSFDQLKQAVTLPMPSQQAESQLEESQRLGQAWRGELGPTEQAAGITGTILQALPLAHLPFTPELFAPAERMTALRQSLFGQGASSISPAADAAAGVMTPEQMGQSLGRNWTGTPPATTEPNPIVQQVNQGLAQAEAQRAVTPTMPIEETLAQARGEPTQTFPSISQSAEEQRRADLIRQERAQQPNVNVETGQQFFPERGAQTQGLQTEGTQRIGEPNASQIQEATDSNGNRGAQPAGTVQAEPGTTENVPSTTTRLRGDTTEGTAQQGEARKGTQAQTIDQAVRSGGTNIPREVQLLDGSRERVAPFQPITPDGDIALASGNTVSRDAVSHVLDENGNRIYSRPQAQISPDQIPQDATVKLNVRTEDGGVEPTELNAREAHDTFTKERDAYANMLDCLAA